MLPPASASSASDGYLAGINHNHATTTGFMDAPSASASPAESTSFYGRSLNLFLKLLFYGCIVAQVVMWPSVFTITFAGALALEGLLSFLFRGNESTTSGLTDYAVLLLHNGKITLTKYVAMCLIAIYTLAFFLLFLSHELSVLPVQTTWIHPTLFGKYSFTDTHNTPFADVGVDSEVSKSMRSWSFEWPRAHQADALTINATILQGQGPAGGALNCSGMAFDCYSGKLAAFKAPDDAVYRATKKAYYYVPFSARFYTADVIVRPPAGMACSALEVYRLNLDPGGNVEHGLDYPASSAAETKSGSVPYKKCGLFGDDGFCLQFLHGFSSADYVAQITSKCALSDNKHLTIRLPSRAQDVDPASGRMGQDILLVTPGASVQMHWQWHDVDTKPSLLTPWEQMDSTKTDASQSWRDASDATSVFFKYAIAITPLLLLWYFLAIRFKAIVESYQILMLCIFVLLPATLFFLTVGAWLPMVGSIICVLAVNHTPATQAHPKAWSPNLRHALLFLTAVCNSVQFVWVLVLVGQSYWSAFYYENTLNQLVDKTNNLIVAGSPTWVGLVLPIELVINFFFLLGAAVCVAMELLAAYGMNSNSNAVAATTMMNDNVGLRRTGSSFAP
jgi:hypothetical protein